MARAALAKILTAVNRLVVCAYLGKKEEAVMYYKIENNQVVECHSIEEWIKYVCSHPDFIVGFTRLYDGTCVVTYFLFVDQKKAHEEGPPILFETCVRSVVADLDKLSARYSTMEEALEGHKKMVKGVSA